ncbi:hypothetical protein LLEC1_07137 [Akanthomyces lecanii]|uniref:Aminoglycoside phosphotransferase domain-containing protein n=1 Tax=Cordyceps confragosa TaxID=2714763 RepID=A0A179I9K4_CORDF|nr:hypothetical protein LLEC1_07137 [Akanthomyces lecanii]
MRATTNQKVAKRGTQAVMRTKDHTGALAVPQMKVDRLVHAMFREKQRQWLDKMLDRAKRKQIGHLVSKLWDGVPRHMPDPQGGSYNLAHIMEFDSNQAAVLRQVNLGTSMFPDEKTTNEVNVMQLVADRTTIPVACVQCAKLTEDPIEKGTKDLDTYDLRPFILMEYLPHNTDMGRALNTPELSEEQPPVLNPKLDPTELKKLCRLAARALLDLWKLEFDAIGSPELIEEAPCRVTRRPLTRRMNELVAMGGCRRADLPQLAFTSTQKYFVALAQLHIDHLAYQQNDAFSDELDCTRKYAARLLFRRMMNSREPSACDEGPFKLWCDDFRPTNILLSGDNIAGVIDWEFAYAAPAEFSCAPPWWLLLQRPEDWEAGWGDWTEKFEVALGTFLEAMTEAEDAAIASESLAEGQRLSRRMRESWENGDFWVMYCLQTDYAFDLVFWNGIFPRHHGSCEDFETAWRKAWSLLTEEEKQGAMRFTATRHGDKVPFCGN